ncbi:hypothetical protein KXX33_006981 [Aspergillus fumigatus]|uniref:Uncharacterized protein n=1 Tax=Aspergillus fumigatus TaxID=746128 RepID=A0A9P8NII5_ASPFM|nr:hypothetical protein KXX45_008059 [Aspergillus fumigatus]KAH1367447.1 hypothetical protein KXX33_006981 [Aspergillus fumigatus]KAH1423206.1 hypothetical protein KXX64_008217 [Aspergillus fumigatus]KAH1495606.1 hypothetical protein KXX06_002279 [Aspergillus fumigatus]KAH1682162.1 hypothetical protein KXX46_004323 [Aspergillus fumigatus]
MTRGRAYIVLRNVYISFLAGFHFYSNLWRMGTLNVDQNARVAIIKGGRSVDSLTPSDYSARQMGNILRASRLPNGIKMQVPVAISQHVGAGVLPEGWDSRRADSSK